MTDWKCPQCKWVNRDFADICLSCGQDRPLGAEIVAAAPPPEPTTWDLQGPVATPMPTMANSSIAEAERAATPGEPFGVTGFPTGVIGAVVAGVIASALWYAIVAFTSIQIGFVAIAVGWLVGTGAVLGARGRGSIWLSGVSVAVTVLALGVSEYLISYHWVTRDLGMSFSVLQPPDVILEIVIAVLQEDPLTLVFWGFAIVASALIPFKASFQPSARPGASVPGY